MRFLSVKIGWPLRYRITTSKAIKAFFEAAFHPLLRGLGSGV